MSKAKRFLEVDTDHYHPNVPVFSFLVGVHNRDGIRIEDNYEDKNVIIQVNEGENDWAAVYMKRDEFIAYLQLLYYHFIEGMEVLQRDADYENRRIDTLSPVASH